MKEVSMTRLRTLAALTLFLTPVAAQAQRPDPAASIAAQREAMAAFARMDGVWRGPAWSITPAGRHEIIQTERIGPFLGGSVRVIEGRGYNADGSVGFNALGVISYNPATRGYTISSWALGQAGVFPITPTSDGYTWEIPAGPGTTIRYTATIRDGTLREIGHRIAGNAPPVQIFEMNLRRIGDTDWPVGTAVPRQ
jgi:hypothetical protein